MVALYATISMFGVIYTLVSNSARDLGESLSDGSIQMHSRGSPMLLTPLSTVF